MKQYLDDEELERSLRHAKSGNKEAIACVVEDIQDLLSSIVDELRTKMPYPPEREDLISEATLALLRCIKTYTRDDGPFRFHSYVKTAAEHALWKYFHDERKRAAAIVIEEPREEDQNYSLRYEFPLSLEKPLKDKKGDEDEGYCIADKLHDSVRFRNWPSHGEIIVTGSTAKKLMAAIKTLPPIQQKIMMLRNGFVDEHGEPDNMPRKKRSNRNPKYWPMSHQKIADLDGLPSKVTVIKYEKEALKALKEILV